MSNKITYILFTTLVILFSKITVAQSVISHEASALLRIIKGKASVVDNVLANPAKYHLQINFTAVEENQGNVKFNDYSLNKDSYYYHPASLIKFPLALISLEMLTQFQQDYGVSLQTPIQSKSCACDFGTDHYVNHLQQPNLDNLYREMLIMSNNEAYNFFYDFVGTNYFNKRMSELNLSNIILRNRFYLGCTGAASKNYGGIRFMKDSIEKSYSINCQTDTLQDSTQTIYLNEPDALTHNVVSLSSIHQLMIQLFYPTAFNVEHPLKMSEDNLNYFKKIISSYPNSIPHYVDYPNHYHKYLLPIHLIHNTDSTLKVYSKNGNASGYLSDVMYFTDQKNKVNYFLSVSMYNAATKYYYKKRAHYSSPGIDFFRQLSKILYNYQKGKKEKASK